MHALARPAVTARKTRVLIVDDSALIRSLLTQLVNRQPDMIAVGAARDPLIAREMIRELDPDVLTLDVEMPHMDGIDFLEKLMRLRPMPVVMVSTMTEAGADVTLRALELGAVDFVAKPRLDITNGMKASGEEIVDKIRIAAATDMRYLAARRTVADAVARPASTGLRILGGTEKLVIVGASTGGTEAIKALLVPLPPDTPGILIVQHMPAGFTKRFSERLDQLCRIHVKEAEDGERVLPGHAYIAPGDRHLSVVRNGSNYMTALSDGPPVNRHRPSVEVLFESAARHVGANALGVMLTGMGKDGATAMKTMRDAGSWNIVQDEASCVVFGMPQEAIKVGAADEVMPLNAIAPAIQARLRSGTGVLHRV